MRTETSPRPSARLPSSHEFPRPVPAPGGEEENALVLRIAAGQSEALGSLYDRTASMALGLLIRILGDPAEAEEILQDVFLQVWRDAGRYNCERSSARGWLMMMARSRALDRLRSAGVRRRTQTELARQGIAVAIAPLGSARLEHRERRQKVSTALDRLPREQREAIELAFYQGMTHTQIAEHLGAPLGTIKSRVLLGMKKLRELLADERDRARVARAA
jgi:RNA polymerase sigma-70 factor (ECF subfamily)